MGVCKLCKKKEANQTGSHILSWFLIREAVNQNGKRRRHNEISFEISSASFVKTYFGNEVLPEEINKTKGKELTDEEINSQENHFTEDYILCTSCEDRLGILESYISSHVFDKLRAMVADDKISCMPVIFFEREAIRVFVYSLLWRSSIVDFNHVQLLSEEEEKLRFILDTNLHLEEQTLLENLKSNSSIICDFPLIFIFLETKGENTNSIFSFKSRKPYCMIINDMSFQLFFKLRDAKRTDEYFFGLNNFVHKKNFLNYKESVFTVAFVSDDKRQAVISRLYSFIADKIMRSAVSMFRYAFDQIFKRKAPQGIVEYFKARAFLNSDDKIEKYTREYFRNIMVDVMYEYVKLLRRYIR